MMQVDVTCRYCHRRLLNGRELGPYDGTKYSFKCGHCNSIQCFASNGKIFYWQFQIGNYSLRFEPDIQIFKIIRLVERTEDPLVVRPAALTLDFLPHNLTPQSCNEERIKRLILFS